MNNNEANPSRRSPPALAAVNQQLTAEIAQRLQTEAALELAKAGLSSARWLLVSVGVFTVIEIARMFPEA